MADRALRSHQDLLTWLLARQPGLDTRFEITDPGLPATIAAIERHMMRDGFVLRHDRREVSESRSRSKAPSWPAACGSPTRGSNDLGLLAEEYDPHEGRQTSNFPRALTHTALSNTAQNISTAKRPMDNNATQRSE